MKPKHTSTPWKFIDGGNSADSCIQDATGVFIGNISLKENAARIVHCVNMHDELVTALKDLEFNCRMVTAFVPHVMLEQAVERARTLLAHVEAVAKKGAE